MSTIRASMVSRPILSARRTSPPLWLTVPPITRAPSAFDTGIDSPVTMDSSTDERPSVTMPSTGIFSPGRTRSKSPTAMASIATSSSPCGEMRRAVFGASPSSARIAPEVRWRARNSSTCPSNTRTVMTEAASKYTATMPCMSRKTGGNNCGANVPTRL